MVEVHKIKPNSMQPRRFFDEEKLHELAESIRQYGVLQPLVVIRQETELPHGTSVEYEIIAGERRWRASQLAGLTQVPVIIREEPSEKVKLEIALIENIQREDLNPLERAIAFKQLVDDFKMRHHEVGTKVGKSREFVSNSIRLLSLPEEIQEGLKRGLINEGHTRPLLSLSGFDEEQTSLYKEIIYRKMNVREAEAASRQIVKARGLRKGKAISRDTEIVLWENRLSDAFGTRVFVEPRGPGKRISIEFFSEEEFGNFLSKMGVGAVGASVLEGQEREISGENFSADAMEIVNDAEPQNFPVDSPAEETRIFLPETEEIFSERGITGDDLVNIIGEIPLEENVRPVFDDTEIVHEEKTPDAGGWFKRFTI